MSTRSSQHVMVVIVILVLLLSSACRASSRETGIVVSPLPTPASLASQSPIATTLPEPETPPTIQILVPEEGKGTVIVVLYDQTLNAPYAFQYIYLAKVLELQKQGGGDSMFFAELDVKTAPFAQTDEDGRLLIENVEPGRYALAVRLPNLVETLLYEAYTQINLYVDINPNEVSDMGVVEIAGPY